MPSSFIIQYTLTLLTIILIPTILWLGKKRQVSIITYIIFGILIIANAVAYLQTDVVAYCYLGIITILALFFVKKPKKQQQ